MGQAARNQAESSLKCYNSQNSVRIAAYTPICGYKGMSHVESRELSKLIHELSILIGFSEELPRKQVGSPVGASHNDGSFEVDLR
jgi:hypothetical protein